MPTTAALLTVIAATLGLPVAAFFAPGPDGPAKAHALRAIAAESPEAAAQAASPSPPQTDPGVDL